jgi:hypothetical protein
MHAFKRAVRGQQLQQVPSAAPGAQKTAAEGGTGGGGGPSDPWLLSDDEDEIDDDGNDGLDREQEEGHAHKPEGVSGMSRGEAQLPSQPHINGTGIGNSGSGSNGQAGQDGGTVGPPTLSEIPAGGQPGAAGQPDGYVDGKSEKGAGESEAGSESDDGEYHGLPWDDPQWDGHPPPEIMPEALAARKAAHDARVAARQAAAAWKGQAGVSASTDPSNGTTAVMKCDADQERVHAFSPALQPSSAVDGQSTAAAAAATAVNAGATADDSTGKDASVVVVEMRDFDAALASLVPSLSFEEVSKYERLRDHYESRDTRR